MGKRNIVWIASYPKSGNTWFRAVLNNLLSDSEQAKSINELDLSGIASSRSLFDQVAGISSSDLSIDEIERYRPQVYKQLSDDSEESIYLKVHDAWTLNRAGDPLFPEDVTRGVIYIIRHPLDVAVSLSHHNSEDVADSLNKMNNASYGLCLGEKRLFNQLPQKMLSWSGHVRSWVIESGLKVHLLKYEDMIDNPFTAFSESLKFLNIEYKKEKLEAAILNSDFKTLKKQEMAAGFNEKPINATTFFRKGGKFDWVNHIKKDRAETFLKENENIYRMFYHEKTDV
jgi:aryl sulfotransferase